MTSKRFTHMLPPIIHLIFVKILKVKVSIIHVSHFLQWNIHSLHILSPSCPIKCHRYNFFQAGSSYIFHFHYCFTKRLKLMSHSIISHDDGTEIQVPQYLKCCISITRTSSVSFEFLQLFKRSELHTPGQKRNNY